jgi:CheY-like chemotaxis protein
MAQYFILRLTWRSEIEMENILLVEDDEADIELIRVVLEEYQLVKQLDIVNDGAAALDYLTFKGHFVLRPKINPKLIVMDLKMPKVNGIEVLKFIKADPLLQKIPVLILTSSNEQQDISAADELGAAAYIVKQVGFQGLVEAVKEHF